jgi:aspartate/methionine/tyrosine aminotransferase
MKNFGGYQGLPLKPGMKAFLLPAGGRRLPSPKPSPMRYARRREFSKRKFSNIYGKAEYLTKKCRRLYSAFHEHGARNDFKVFKRMENTVSINIFKLEDYLTHYEFSAPYLLCCSDAESFSLQEILKLASSEEKALWDNLRLGYTEVVGMPALREQIAKSLYQGLTGENIFCFAGAEDGIFCALYTVCEKGDHVIVLTPCYQSLKEIPKTKGAIITEIELREEDQWNIDIDALKKAIKINTKCIVINFPHNPTGQIITEQQLNELINLCREHDIWLFSDEVYRPLGNPKHGFAPPAAVLYPKALSLGVMSKALGMAGLRIGWIACQDPHMLKKIEYMKHYTSICNSAPSEILSLIALKNKDAILARNNKIVADNLKLLDHFMDEHQDLLEWVRPQGGCVGFVKYKAKESVEDFSQKLLQKQGVLLLPASVYDVKSNHFRIGFGRKNMPQALDRLREFFLTNQRKDAH